MSRQHIETVVVDSLSKRAGDEALFVAGESLRAVALGWLALAVALVAAAPLFASPWLWLDLALAVVMALTGLAYWWVVPAPADENEPAAEASARQLATAAALLDSGKRLTLFGVTIAAAFTAIADLASDLPPGVRITLTGACAAAILTALWWTRAPFIWSTPAQAIPGGRVSILYNGRFVLRNLARLHAIRREIAREAMTVRQQRSQILEAAVSTSLDADRQALLKQAALIQTRLSELMAIDDLPSLAGQNLRTLLTAMQSTVRVNATWIVPRAWALIIGTAVPKWIYSTFAIRSAHTPDRLNEWRSLPLDAYLHLASTAPYPELLAVAARTTIEPANRRVEAIEAILERWRGTTPRDRQANLTTASESDP